MAYVDVKPYSYLRTKFSGPQVLISWPSTCKGYWKQKRRKYYENLQLSWLNSLLKTKKNNNNIWATFYSTDTVVKLTPSSLKNMYPQIPIFFNLVYPGSHRWPQYINKKKIQTCCTRCLVDCKFCIQVSRHYPVLDLCIYSDIFICCFDPQYI